MASDEKMAGDKSHNKDGREKKTSRIKKLKRRISATFGRLSLSKDDTIHESDQESDSAAISNGKSDHVFHRYPAANLSLHRCSYKAEPRSKAVENTQRDFHTLDRSHVTKIVKEERPTVKRHHSAGDMIEGAFEVVTPQRQQHHERPRSEGHKFIGHFSPKRTSAYGVNSPFGKADSYQKLEQLGEGSYATVYKGYSSLTQQTVALKEIRLQTEEGAPFTAIREASLLKGLKHANIVTLHDIIHTTQTLTFVFEYVHTDLSQYLERHPGGINAFNVKLLLFQLLRGLAYCHQRRILHRDVKPQNLLISESGELKLADFGLARAKSIPSHTYSHEVVTLWYRPPDVLLGSTNYSTSLDMWGVGCIFTEMISGVATFPGMKDVYDQLDKIFRILGTPTDATWEGVSKFTNYKLDKIVIYPSSCPLGSIIPKIAFIQHAEDLANLFLQMNPAKRISAVAAMKHRYFADLPPKIHDLPEVASIFNIPGIKFLPEVDENLSNSSDTFKTKERTRIRTTLKV